jgi:nucleoside-diphosphate-sugar epimerase
MTVLVTGGLGAIGAATVRLLASMGHPVVVAARSHHYDLLDRDTEGVVIETCDIRDIHEVYGILEKYSVDRVCHLAAVLSGEGEQHPFRAYEVNVGASVQLFEASRRVGIQRFVFVSSKAVYAPPDGAHAWPTYAPITEEHPTKPASLYGATKLAAEVMLARLGANYNLSTAILRFGTTYGPGKTSPKYVFGPEVTKMIEAARTGTPLTVVDTGEQSDYVYIRDVASGIALAALADRPGVETYNIATGIGLTLGDVRDALASVAPTASLELIEGPRDPRNAKLNMVMDISKAARQLGYRPQYDLRASIEDHFTTARAHSPSLYPVKDRTWLRALKRSRSSWSSRGTGADGGKAMSLAL